MVGLPHDVIDDASPELRALAERVGMAVLAVLRDTAAERLPAELSRTLRDLIATPSERDEPSLMSRGVDDLPLPACDGSLFTPPLPAPAEALLLLPTMHATPVSPRPSLWSRYERRERLSQRDGVDTWLVRERAGERRMLIDVLPPMAEAECAATLSAAERLAGHPHAHVARVAAAALEDGVCHLVHETTAGETLEALLARGEVFAAHDALRLIAQAAQGLAHVAELTGRAHGDLNPARLTVAYPGGDEGERLVVGGLLLPTAAWQDPAMTAEHGAAYIAPERHAAGIRADLAGDVYALGAILSRLLSGAEAELPEPVRTLIATATAADPACRFLSWRGFQVSCDKALGVLAPQAAGSLRIVRRAMPKPIAISWCTGEVIAPELLDDDAPAAPREDLRTITGRIARAHRARVAEPIQAREIPTLVRRAMPVRQQAPIAWLVKDKAAAPAKSAEDLATITTRIMRKHQATVAPGVPDAPRLLRDGKTVRAHLRAIRRKLLARPRTLGTRRTRAPAVELLAEDAIEVTPRDLSLASALAVLLSIAFAYGLTELTYVVLAGIVA